jgi:RNA polymerase sigma-32 factor
MTNALIRKQMTLPAALSAGSVDAYIQTVNQIPVLSAEEEFELATRYQEEEDVNAARRLVLAHLRFVVHVARGYNGYGLALADLIQEGNIGLMKAVKRFDPHQGVRLVSFAVHWIRAEIHEFILRNWRIVKVATTKAQRKLFFNLRSAKKRLGWLSRDEVNAVAADLGVSPDAVLEMESRLAGQDVAFDAQPDSDDEEAYRAPAAYLEDMRFDPSEQTEREDWEVHSTRRLREALDSLDPRSRDILEQRWLAEEKRTLQDLADEYGVSAERIRQVEKNAMQRVRGYLEA